MKPEVQNHTKQRSILVNENMDHEMGHILNVMRQNGRVGTGASSGNRKRKQLVNKIKKSSVSYALT